MYEYLDNNTDNMRVIGSFSYDKNSDYKASVKNLFESFQSSYQLDAISDISKILRVETLKESYKEALLSDVQEMGFDDEYYATMPAKLDQLFENSALEMLTESSAAALAPIVGITLPVLKKSYIEGHSKDIVMTEIPTKPIIKAAFERRFLKDKAGNKHYIPDIFYNDSYKEIMNQGKGKKIPATWYPEAEGATLPIQDFNILGAAGGSIETRDTLALNFCIEGVMMNTAAEGEAEALTEVAVHVQPNLAANSSFTAEVKTEAADGNVVKDILVGQVDFYHGTVSVASTAGRIKKVKFGGNLSNENNVETIELDRERELMEWKIPDGTRINTGLTLEQIKDYKALFDFDITTEIISDMSVVLSQYEDSEILSFLSDSFDKWKDRKQLPFGYTDGFTELGYFNCEPPANKFVTRSQWIDTELKYDLNRFIDELKVKLRNQDLMFVVYGHPNNITLIQDNVRWVIDEDTKIGGIQLDYRFGVMTANKNRIHVISTLKCPRERGLRVVAYPLTKEVITFKHYKYSLNIENAYRNALTPLTPNVMGTSRFLTTEVLPVQGELHLAQNKFSLDPNNNTPTLKAMSPEFSLAADGTWTAVSATYGAEVHYTVDGSEPTVDSPVAANGVIDLGDATGDITVKAVAIKAGYIKSGVATTTVTVG